MKTIAQLISPWSAAVLLLAGCPASSSGGAGDMQGTEDAATAGDTNCGLPPFALNMEASGATLNVKLIDAMPSPPEKNQNDWTVEITDQDGKPITSPDDFVVQPWMPEHGHGTNGRDPVVTALSTPGQFLLSPVYMWMGGLWEIRFKSPGQTASADWAVLHACIKD